MAKWKCQWTSEECAFQVWLEMVGEFISRKEKFSNYSSGFMGEEILNQIQLK